MTDGSNKFTQKVVSVFNDARDLALEQQNAELCPVHLAFVLIDDQEGLARHALVKAGGENAYSSIRRLLNKSVNMQAKVDPAPTDVYMGSDALRTFQEASKVMKERGDTFLGVDSLFLALLANKELARMLEESGLSRQAVKNAAGGDARLAPRGYAKWRRPIRGAEQVWHGFDGPRRGARPGDWAR